MVTHEAITIDVKFESHEKKKKIHSSAHSLNPHAASKHHFTALKNDLTSHTAINVLSLITVFS